MASDAEFDGLVQPVLDEGVWFMLSITRRLRSVAALSALPGRARPPWSTSAPFRRCWSVLSVDETCPRVEIVA